MSAPPPVTSATITKSALQDLTHLLHMSSIHMIRHYTGQVETNGIRCRADGAMSSMHCNSKRAKMKLLAADRAGQHQRQKHKPRDVPGPPTSLRKRSYEAIKPRRRCGRIKSEARNVRRKWKDENTYQGRDNAIACAREGIGTLCGLTIKSRMQGEW